MHDFFFFWGGGGAGSPPFRGDGGLYPILFYFALLKFLAAAPYPELEWCARDPRLSCSGNRAGGVGVYYHM
jgi:hypothetical protein